MAAKETGKQRAARIPLDYFKHPTRLERWKEWLGVIALVVSGGWLAAGLLRQDQGDLRYSRGPVANVHQTWDANCAACHEAFVPIQSDHWAANWMPSWFKSTRQDHQCTTCHSGIIHHQNEKMTLGCVSCHHEHRGRDASLVRLADRDCTQCHADLAAFVKAGKQLQTPKEMQNIRGFSTTEGHGDFQRLGAKAAEQKLKFSHDRHLAPGMWTEKRGDPKFTLSKLAPADRKRYEEQQRDKGDAALVKLECSSCHQLDRAGASERPAGDYMLPIRYEAHCQACHPLTIERTDDKDRHSSKVAVPHRLQPQEIRHYLEGLYTAKVLKNDLKAFEQFVGKRPLPGKLPEGKTVLDYYKRIEAAEKLLFLGNTNCRECHHYDPADALDAPQTDSSAPPKFRIAPTRVPQVWFEHALFNHAAHRAIACVDCHEKGLEKDGKTPITLTQSDKSEHTFIPMMSKCVECHAPQTTANGSIKGGARHDCTECHRYHNADHALQGMGAARRDPRVRRPIDAFLNTGK